jgi:hypothetical protein
VSRFPAAFRLPAFASRSSDSRRGIPPSSRSAYRPKGRTPTGLPRSARTSCDRGGCPLYPEDGGALPGLRDVLSRRLPLNGGQSFHPAPTSHRAGLRFTRHQRGFTRFTRPVFPSPVASRMERARPWAFPRASHPAVTGGARRGWGQAIEHGPQTTLTTSAEPPILRVHSLRATSRRTVHSGRLTFDFPDARNQAKGAARRTSAALDVRVSRRMVGVAQRVPSCGVAEREARRSGECSGRGVAAVS